MIIDFEGRRGGSPGELGREAFVTVAVGRQGLVLAVAGLEGLAVQVAGRQRNFQGPGVLREQ